MCIFLSYFFFFSSRRRHTRSLCDWSSDVCSSDLSRPPRSGYPRPPKSYTGGEKSSLPLNHGFTVCWSDESTSVRWPGMSERTWLVSTSSVSVSPAARHSASRQLPSATAAREAARASARHVGRDALGSAVARSAARTRSRNAPGARNAGTRVSIAARSATRPSRKRAQSAHWARCASSSRRWMRASSRRSEEHTSELQSHSDLVCRLLLEKKKKKQ